MSGHRNKESVAGIVLAAGSSRRMGRDKLYLALDGETVLHRAARRALEAGLDPVLVVVGPDPGRARDALAGLSVSIVQNPDHASGMNTSLRCGLAEVPDECAAALVLLADMPFVTSEMLREVAARYRKHRAPLVVSRYGEATAPPTLYERGLFAEFQGDACGKHVVKRHRDEAEIMDWQPALLCDLDVEDDYRRALDRVAATGDQGAA